MTYIVNEDLAGRGERIKSYNIGVEVLHLGKNFDPYVNPAVRLHAGRLRTKLESYYRFSGNPGKVLITIPKGSYRPRFSYISQTGLTDSPPVADEQNPQAIPHIPLAVADEVPTDDPAAPELEQNPFQPFRRLPPLFITRLLFWFYLFPISMMKNPWALSSRD